MDKKGVLINRLQEQYQQGTDDSFLLNTALLLIKELQQSQEPASANTSAKVSIIMPVKPFEVVSNGIASLEENTTVEKTDAAISQSNSQTDNNLNEVFENNILPESEIEPPVEELVSQSHMEEPEKEPIQPIAINTLAEEKYNDVILEIPTLAQQQPKVVYELNQSLQSDEPSINDKLKQSQTETGNQIHSEPIRDLRKAIGINDKYVFIRELFRNDEAAYERSLKTINSFNILPEAEYWIQRELKYKLGWDDSNPSVKSFLQLVRRRFS